MEKKITEYFNKCLNEYYQGVTSLRALRNEYERLSDTVYDCWVLELISNETYQGCIKALHDFLFVLVQLEREEKNDKAY